MVSGLSSLQMSPSRSRTSSTDQQSDSRDRDGRKDNNKTNSNSDSQSNTNKNDKVPIVVNPTVEVEVVNPFDQGYQGYQGYQGAPSLLAFDPLLQNKNDEKKHPKSDQKHDDFYSDISDLVNHPFLMTQSSAAAQPAHPATADPPISTQLPPRRKTIRSHRSHKSLGSADFGGIFKSNRARGHTVDNNMATTAPTTTAPTTTATSFDSDTNNPMQDSSNKMERLQKIKNHRKSNSISSIAELVSSFGHSSSVKTATTSSSKTKPTISTPHASPGRPPPKNKTLTPTRILQRTSAANTPTKTSAGIAPTPVLPGLHIPLLAKPSPTSLLLEGDDLAMRTSEQEPSSHQIEIPEPKHLILHAKLCELMDSYRLNEDSIFSLSSLVGVPNLALREFAFFGKGNLQSSAGLLEKHQPIVKALLECAEGITVEGYAAVESAEVAIFEIPALSQIVGVFRGSDERQVKPFSTKHARQCTATDVLHPDHPVTVVPVFREAYFELEQRFYTLIDRLSDGNPFAKVVLSGHSFGAALATLAAVRYASFRPTMMVSAHVFGSPKVGAANFRHLANSISNLKIIRVETKDDIVVNTPADHATANKTKWDHVGHSIVLGGSGNNKQGSVTAYRFEDFKPPPHTPSMLFRKLERDSKAYVAALEHCKERWVKDFVGVGDGVLGKNDEKRLMV